MAKKNRVPKRIAGLKLPKALRRGLKDLAASQNGRTVLVEALTTAGAALAASQAKTGSATRAFAAKQKPKVKAAAAQARAQAVDARATTMAALEDAARAFTEALRRRGLGEATPPAPPAGPPSAATH